MKEGLKRMLMQVVYLDVDTLWIDSMANVEQEFTEMREKNALFGMSIETTELNGNGSWYKGGRPHGVGVDAKCAFQAVTC